jgi:hypothetical protein
MDRLDKLISVMNVLIALARLAILGVSVYLLLLVSRRFLSQ